MAASKQEISVWFDEGVQDKATHMIVVTDTWDYEDYPVFVGTHEDVRRIEANWADRQHSKVTEVYNLSLDKESQLNEYRAFNY